MKLSPKHKCLFRYLTERCDQAGVWEPNWALASIYIGEKCDASDLMVLSDQIEPLENGKIFIPDFINFQYGRISENSPAHKPVLRAIEKNNLSDRLFNRVSNTLQEKEKEKEEDKEEEDILYNLSDIEERIFTDRRFIEILEMTHKGKDFKQAFSECYLFHSNSREPPKTIGEWKQKFNSWLIRWKPPNGQREEKNRYKIQ